MADWFLPTLSSLYADVISLLRGRDEDNAKMATPTNPVIGHKRWNSTTRRFEEWTGSAWIALPTADVWIDHGHVPVYVGVASFKVVGSNVAATYVVGNRVRVLKGANYLYGVVASSAWDAGNGWTLVGVTLDSGTLDATIAAVALSAVDASLNALVTAPVAKGGTGATTVLQALVNLGVPLHSVEARSSTAADVVGDRGKVLACTGAITRTLPAASSANGLTLVYTNVGTGILTVSRAGADTIDGQTSLDVYPGEVLILVADGASTWRNLNGLTRRLSMPPVSRSTGFTPDRNRDGGRLQRCTATLAITLPAASGVPAGWTLPVANVGAGAVVTINRAGSDLIAGAVSKTLLNRWDSCTLVSDGVSSWDVVGAASSSGGGLAEAYAINMLGLGR
jgi:hypothetical protein